MCYLYWIHRSCHNDLTTDGYVGVTNNLSKRLYNHKQQNRNPHLTNAFKKYDDIVHTILLEGSEQYCYEIEESLRPIFNIGWNINKGGTKPPGFGMQNKTHSVQTKQKMSMSAKKQSEQRKARLSKHWIIIDPQGMVFPIVNIKQFCRDHGINNTHMTEVAQGKRMHHKGWKCQYAFDEGMLQAA